MPVPGGIIDQLFLIPVLGLMLGAPLANEPLPRNLVTHLSPYRSLFTALTPTLSAMVQLEYGQERP